MTPLLSLIVPTIDGREYLLEQTIGRLAEVTKADFPDDDVELIVVENHPTIGEAWNAGMEDAIGRYVWLGADDALMAPEALAYGADAAGARAWPSPRITNPDGTLHSCGTLGGGMLMDECETGTRCYASPFPLFLRSEWTNIGPCLPIHYYADDYLGWRATSAGFPVMVIRGYEIQHLEGKVGRAAVTARAMADRRAFLEAIACA